jgi:hypothetical protein
MKKKKPLPKKNDVWTFEQSEFIEDAMSSAKEALSRTHEDDEKTFLDMMETTLAIVDVKLSDIIVRGIRAKNAPAKGGRANKKEPAFNLLVEYVWQNSKRKTCLSMWGFLKKKLKEGELSGQKIIEDYDFVYEKKENKITLYFNDKKRRPRDMGFRSFQRCVKDFKEELKKDSQ